MPDVNTKIFQQQLAIQNGRRIESLKENHLSNGVSEDTQNNNSCALHISNKYRVT